MLKFGLKESVGVQIVLSFNTSIVQTLGGLEQRVVNWDRGLLKFDLSKAILSQEELDYLLEFHNAVLGKKEAFLYSDPSDYQATHYSSDGGSKYNFSTRGILRKISTNTFKAYKKYTVQGKTIYRPIEFLDQETFEGYEYRSDSTINPITCTIDPQGIITTTSNLISGSDYYWEGDFFVKVRFDLDEIEYKIVLETENEVVYSVPKTSFIEVRSNTESYQTFDPNNTIGLSQIDLALDLTIVPSFATNVKQLDSGFERRDEERTIPVAKWRLGERQTLIKKDLEYLLTFFRVARGKASNFLFADRTGYKNPNFENDPEILFPVRFNSDDLGITIEGNEVFGVDGLELKELLYDVKTIVRTVQVVTSIFSQERYYQINLDPELTGYFSLRSRVKSIVPSSNNAPNVTPSGYFTLNGTTYNGSQLMGLQNLNRYCDIPLSGVIFVDPSGHYVPMASLEFTIEWSGIKAYAQG